MADTWKVVVNSLIIREQPNASSKKLGSLYSGQELQVDQVSGNWVHHNRGPGWSCATASSGKSYIVRTAISQDTPMPPAENSTTESVKIQEENLRDYDEMDLISSTNPAADFNGFNFSSVSSSEEYLNSIQDSLSVDNCRGIHGMPYQFMPIADTRISNRSDSFGRKYSEKIVSRMPILCLTPGKPVFLDDYNSSTKRSVLDTMISKLGSGVSNSVESLLGGHPGKFYSIKFDYQGYYNYVNTLCRNAAYFMGLENEEVNGHKLKSFDWGGSSMQSDLGKVINYTECVPFYIDSEKSISESFSNESGQSTLKSTADEMSNMGRELQFLLGSASSATGIGFDNLTSQENLLSNMENVNGFIDGVLGKGNGNIFKRITGNIQTVVSGGKLIFPEIWSDSSFSRSFNINQTLVSPDTDDLSIYLNILVPMFHWICLAAPREAIAQGYISPYIIRGFYKGMFNVDMGMINGLNFTKGDEGSWTRSGLPTIVKVSADIKDLYSAFSMSDNRNGEINAFNNTIYMDYIANMCGININEVDIYRNIEMYLMSKGNNIADKVRFDIFRGLEQNWTNAVNKIYRNAFF